MDLMLMLIGFVLTSLGSRSKDAQGNRSGLGISLMVVGIVFLVSGAFVFVLGFIAGASGALG